MLMYFLWALFGVGLTAGFAAWTISWVHRNEMHRLEWAGPVSEGTVLILTAIGAIGGSFIVLICDSMKMKTLGYFLMASSLGIMLGPVLALHTGVAIFKALLLTCMALAIFGFIGTIAPGSLDSWGAPLLFILSMVVVAQFGIPILVYLFPGLHIHAVMHVMDWVVIILFCAYIMYDINQMLSGPMTDEMAILGGMNLYLDIANIFIRILAESDGDGGGGGSDDSSGGSFDMPDSGSSDGGSVDGID